MIRLLRLAAVLVLGCACPSQQPTRGPAADEPAPAPAAAGSGFQIKVTMDCPAYVRGSETRLEDVEGGVAVVITARLADLVQDIQRFAAYAAEASAQLAKPETALQFGGRTGDRTRNCPVILKDTVVTYEPQPQGARLVVKSKRPEDTEAMRRAARENLDVVKALHAAGTR